MRTDISPKNSESEIGSSHSAQELRLTWQLTPRCDLRCSFCELPEKYSKCEDMTYTQVIHGLKWFAKQADKLSVVWSGGEPTLRDDLFRLSKHASDLGYQVGLVSNGGRLTGEVLEGILNGSISLLIISLDGADSATHDQLRNCAGLFKRIVSSVRTIVANRPSGLRIGFNSVITATNAGQVEKLIELSEELEVDFIRLTPVEHFLSLRPAPGTFERILSIRQSYPGKTCIQLPYAYVAEVENYLRDRVSTVSPCYAMMRFAHIDLHGQVLPCHCRPPVGSPLIRLTDVSLDESLVDIYPHFPRGMRPVECQKCLVFNNWVNISDEICDFIF